MVETTRYALAHATLAAAADALAAGNVTAVQLIQDIVAAHAAVDAELNAYRTFDAETALAAAAASDERRSRGAVRGPFDGVPVAIKDNISVAGQPNTCASKLLAGYTATYDATVVEKLKAAGFIPLGRTNMDEFAMGSSTENSAYGPTANPAARGCVPGGSSGGSAAVVAAREAIAALGSDTGGSIRQPAGFCGVVGLKPTYGRVSRYGLTAFASSLDQIGPLTQTVEDSAILLDAIAGQDPRDCTSLPEAAGGFRAALADADVRGLRVGLPAEYMDVDGLDAAVRSSVDAAVEQLRESGAVIVPVQLPHTQYAVATYYVIATAEASSNLARFDGIRYGRRSPDAEDVMATYKLSREQGFGQEVKRRIILGTFVLSGGYHDAYYGHAQKVRTLIRRDFTAAFAHCDLILGPVAPTPAFRIGEITDPLTMYLADIYTIPVNLAGNCAICIPGTPAPDGRPIGLQLIGPDLAETTLLRAAHWLEQQQGARA